MCVWKEIKHDPNLSGPEEMKKKGKSNLPPSKFKHLKEFLTPSRWSLLPSSGGAQTMIPDTPNPSSQAYEHEKQPN